MNHRIQKIKYSGVKIRESQKGEKENYLSMIDGASSRDLVRGLKNSTDIYQRPKKVENVQFGFDSV